MLGGAEGGRGGGKGGTSRGSGSEPVAHRSRILQTHTYTCMTPERVGIRRRHTYSGYFTWSVFRIRRLAPACIQYPYADTGCIHASPGPEDARQEGIRARYVSWREVVAPRLLAQRNTPAPQAGSPPHLVVLHHTMHGNHYEAGMPNLDTAERGHGLRETTRTGHANTNGIPTPARTRTLPTAPGPTRHASPIDARHALSKTRAKVAIRAHDTPLTSATGRQPSVGPHGRTTHTGTPTRPQTHTRTNSNPTSPLIIRAIYPPV